MNEDNITGFIQALGNMESAILTREKEKETPMPEIKDEDPTRKRLKEMLCQNTGVDICDSGGEFGRSWQQNRLKDFDKEPRVSMEVYEDNGVLREMICSINVYHFLLDKAGVELPPADDPILKLWKEWSDSEQAKDMYWPEVMEGFVGFCHMHKIELMGLHGGCRPSLLNTYNAEDSLSQILQHFYFKTEDAAYALIQIHNGADARGGYTDPELFRMTNDEGLFYNNDMVLQCSNEDCGYEWYTDDGYHWYGHNGVKNFNEYKKIKVKDKKIICPECKKGILEADF